MPDETVPAAGDPRFTAGLVLDVARAIEAHGYEPVDDGRELVELQQHIWCFLHGRERGQTGCYGGAR